MDRSHPIVVEPAMFPHAACAVVLEGLIDNLDQTIVFVASAREPATGRLTGLWSSSPVGLENYTNTLRIAVAEFTKMLWENSGPFA